MPNIIGLTLSINNIINEIKILKNPVSAAEEMIPGSAQCYQLRLVTSVVSEQRYILTSVSILIDIKHKNLYNLVKL